MTEEWARMYNPPPREGHLLASLREHTRESPVWIHWDSWRNRVSEYEKVSLALWNWLENKIEEKQPGNIAPGDSEAIRDALTLEIDNLKSRHATGKKILEFMGAAAPAFGMIGTLIGLVQMLTNLSSPDDIGSGMATALLTTFYGAFAANLIFIPLAGKLGIYSQAEATSKEMLVEGVCAIAQGENPTAVREKMHAFVSQSRREEVKANI